MGDTVFCTSLAGEEIGRILTWGTHPARHGDYQLASPSCDIPQTYLEPILVRAMPPHADRAPVLDRVPHSPAGRGRRRCHRAETAWPGNTTRSGPST